MPVDTILRNKILNWIKEEIPYSEIMDLVKKEGATISRGGITYIKKSSITEQTEQKTEEKTEQTEQKKEKSNASRASKKIETTKEGFCLMPNCSNQVYEDKLICKTHYFGLYEETPQEKLLSDLEFTLLKSSFETVYNSNKIRLEKANAKGILNSLNNVRYIIEIIEKRGNYQ